MLEPNREVDMDGIPRMTAVDLAALARHAGAALEPDEAEFLVAQFNASLGDLRRLHPAGYERLSPLPWVRPPIA